MRDSGSCDLSSNLSEATSSIHSDERELFGSPLTRLEIIPKGVLHHHGDEHAVEYIANLGRTGVHLIDRFDFLEGSEILIFRKDRI